eukprot:Gb_22213 [translate_table: standard]
MVFSLQVLAIYLLLSDLICLPIFLVAYSTSIGSADSAVVALLNSAIPPQLGIITQLEVLQLSENQLSGNIPNSLSNCSQLRQLRLSLNRLSGIIPMELGQLPLLEILYLHDNQLVSGNNTTLSILTALTNCSLLQLIDLGDNYLTGVLIVSIGQFSTKLNYLRLSGNNIGGELPQQIANLTSLTYLDLSSNNFTGRIPSALGRLQMLQKLYLDGNKLEGSIPIEFVQLNVLQFSSLSGNMLSGPIPQAFTNLKQLRYLFLESNHLSGNIPASLGQSWSLEALDLSDNKFRGKIPPEVAGLQNLTFLNLSGNLLEGRLPPEVGKMIYVQVIDISKNRLSGQIPATIESCSELQSLNLSWNALQGPIPNSLVQLKSLEDVDLSYNNLSGSIPKSLGELGMLRHLNLSFNNFSGEIPRSGVFTNLTVTSFMGNPGLCAQWLNMRNCSRPRIDLKPSKWRFHIILGISLGVAFLSITAVMLITIHLWRKLRKPERNNLDLRMYIDTIDSRPVSVENFLQGYASGPTRYSYRQIRKYTHNFRDKLGQGGFGQVFKGKLPNGSLVAVKLLDKWRQSETAILERSGDNRENSSHSLGPPVGILFSEIQKSVGLRPVELHICTKNVQIASYTATSNPIMFFWRPVTRQRLQTLVWQNWGREESHMSMTAARGTPGYAAPDMWSRNHGPVTDKSDVYSYGMLLLEMVEKGEFGNLRMRSEDGIKMEFLEAEEQNIAKKLTLIGLSCIHYDSSHRPSLVKVIEMLEGSVQVTIPSFPFPPAYVPARPASISGESSSYSF